MGGKSLCLTIFIVNFVFCYTLGPCGRRVFHEQACQEVGRSKRPSLPNRPHHLSPDATVRPIHPPQVLAQAERLHQGTAQRAGQRRQHSSHAPCIQEQQANAQEDFCQQECQGGKDAGSHSQMGNLGRYCMSQKEPQSSHSLLGQYFV